MMNNETSLTSMKIRGVSYDGCFSRTLAQFDNSWYNIEGNLVDFDPHAAMLLRSITECLESAGFNTDPSDRLTPENWGVFAALPAAASAAAGCIAQVLKFTGPTVVMSTSSASLSALSQACLHLKMKKCEAAFVCGARAILNKEHMVTGGKNISPGDGSGAILLMPLSEVRKLHKRCLAILKTVSSGFVPSTACQPMPNHQGVLDKAGLLNKAFCEAGLISDDVSYVEVNTIEEKDSEFDAIKLAFKPRSSASVVIGSAKANVGDMGVASGIAGLVKTITVLKHALAPGTPRKIGPLKVASAEGASRVTVAAQVASSETVAAGSTAGETVAASIAAGIDSNETVTAGVTEDTSRLIKVFPSHKVDLCASKPGKLISAAVSFFSDSGTCETAVLQQYSMLPHMAGVPIWLVLGAEHIIGDTRRLVQEAERIYYPGIFEKLKGEFPIIKNTLRFLDITCEGTFVKYSFTIREKAAASFSLTVLKLYYALLTQLSSLDAGVFAIWSTNAMNEITALLFAGVIDVVGAILLVSGVGVIKRTENPVALPILAKMMTMPEIPVYSCVQGKFLNMETFEDENLLQKYIEDLVANLGRANDIKHYQKMLWVREKSRHHKSKPVLHITTGVAAASTDDIVNISFRGLQEGNVQGYLREKYLDLRSSADRIRMRRIRRPSSDDAMILPRFYAKYPFRKAVEERLQEQERLRPQVQQTTSKACTIM